MHILNCYTPRVYIYYKHYICYKLPPQINTSTLYYNSYDSESTRTFNLRDIGPLVR